MEVALFLGRRLAVAAGRALNGADTGSERPPDRFEPFDCAVRAADHEAETTFESPHATAGAAVDIVDPQREQLLRRATSSA